MDIAFPPPAKKAIQEKGLSMKTCIVLLIIDIFKSPTCRHYR